VPLCLLNIFPYGQILRTIENDINLFIRAVNAYMVSSISRMNVNMSFIYTR
jgi:hypothetical protein